MAFLYINVSLICTDRVVTSAALMGKPCPKEERVVVLCVLSTRIPVALMEKVRRKIGEGRYKHQTHAVIEGLKKAVQ